MAFPIIWLVRPYPKRFYNSKKQRNIRNKNFKQKIAKIAKGNIYNFSATADPLWRKELCVLRVLL